MIQITALYAAILALAFVHLSIRVIRIRRNERVGIGTAGRPAIERAMRVHANFAEYVPLTLLLLAFLELNAAPVTLLHVLCAGLLLGRVVHAWGVSQSPENYRFRIAGMAATFTVIIAAALSLVIQHFA